MSFRSIVDSYVNVIIKSCCCQIGNVRRLKTVININSDYNNAAIIYFAMLVVCRFTCELIISVSVIFILKSIERKVLHNLFICLGDSLSGGRFVIMLHFFLFDCRVNIQSALLMLKMC